MELSASYVLCQVSGTAQSFQGGAGLGGMARWRPRISETLQNLGCRWPADADAAQAQVDVGRFLLRCLAVAGFAAMNIMMFSVPIWADAARWARRRMLRLGFALIAAPAAMYAASPFPFRMASAEGAARLDVPISRWCSLGVSIAETWRQGPRLFRWRDDAVFSADRPISITACERARTAARDLLALRR